MKAWMWIVLVAALVLGVLFVWSRTKKTTGPTLVTGSVGSASPAGTIAGAFTNLVGAAAGVAADWITSKSPSWNTPIQPAPIGGAGSTPKLSTPSNFSNTVYSA